MAKVEDECRRDVQGLFWNSSIFLQPLLTPCLLSLPKQESGDRAEHSVQSGRTLYITGQRAWIQERVKSGAIDAMHIPPHGLAHLFPMPSSVLSLPIEVLHLSFPLRLRSCVPDSVSDHSNLLSQPRP